MKRYLGGLATVLLFGASVLGVGEAARAQQVPDNQQPMEIPAPYPPQYPSQQNPAQQYPPQSYPAQQYPPQQYPAQQGGPQQGGPQGNAQQPGPTDAGAGRISYINGDLSTQHSNSSEWDAATVNTPVLPGDHISTGQRSRTEIQLDHANILRLSDQTVANVVNLSPTQIQVQVGPGLVTYDVLKGSEANVEIDTPNVAIRPQMAEGSYRIQVNPDGETIVDVRNGSAEVSTNEGSTRVDRDQSITIQGSGENAQYQIAGLGARDEWDRWNSDRDHSIQSAQSWQHTNPYYTGTQDLDQYGQWNNVPDYGPVWFPAAAPGWAPYRVGRWVFEPYYGWTWVSYEPWGWAPYHYGRWFVYGGNWGWWPGPVYAGYRPIWAPAYVSFFGFEGGGFGVGVGFGFGGFGTLGGFGTIGWLPVGPADRFYPWYGRGVARVGVASIYNARSAAFGGFAPLRSGPGALSNINGALTDERLRGGISSMASNQFGRGIVPSQQQRFDGAALRQASVMTGASPISPSRESFRASDRQVNATTISRSAINQRFFGGSRTGASSQAGFNRGGTAYNQPNRSGYQTFNPSSRGTQPSAGSRSYEAQGTPQSRSYSSPSAQPRYQGNQGQGNQGNASRGSYGGGYGGSRPPLNMQQPIVAPRSYSAPAVRSAPSGGSRGGSSGGGSRGGSSGRGGRR